MEHKLKFMGFVFLVFLLPNISSVWGSEVVNYMEGSMKIHNVLSLNSFAKEVKLSIESIMNNRYQSAVLYPLSRGNVVINKSYYGEKYEFTYSSLPPGRVVLDAYGYLVSRDIREPSKGPVDVRFLEPTEHIQSDNSRIKGLAKKIVGNENEDKYKVVKVVEWIRNNLQYDERYADKNYDALSILDMRRGVCAEYTTLFVAFMRSLGIPARYASGYAYNGKEWERHAYAEVYVGGKWIPVDVLWGQIGFVDASHLLFSYSVDNQRSDSLEIEGNKREEVKWIEDNYYFNISNLVKLNLTHMDVVVIEKEENEMGMKEGSWGTIIVHINNPYSFEYMENISVIPCLGSNLKFNRTNEIIWLRRGENYVVFPFYVNKGLKRGYKVECPVVIKSMFGENKVEVIKYYSPLNTLTPNNEERENRWEILYNPIVDYESSNLIYIEGEGKRYYVVSPYSFTSIDGREVEIRPYKLGKNTFYIISNNEGNKGEAKKVEFIVKKYKYIRSILLPHPLFTGSTNVTILLSKRSIGKKVMVIVRDKEGNERYKIVKIIKKDKMSFLLPISSTTTLEIYVLGKEGEIEKHLTHIKAWDDLVVQGKIIIKNEKGIKMRELVNNTALYNLSVKCYNEENNHPVNCYINISDSYLDVFIPSISAGNYLVNITYIYRRDKYEVTSIHVSLLESIKLYLKRYIKHLKTYFWMLER